MRLCGILILVGSILCANPEDEEALFLRRIADFWEEKEYQIAKSQIEEFIATYPDSSYAEALSAALGDLYLREKNFSQALDYYTRIQTPEFFDQVFFNRMQCLYEMQWHATLAQECESYLKNGPNLQASFFLATALYHQCLNASKEPEILFKLAQRAKPHFEMLYQSELSSQIAQGYAHICCLLKEFPKAAEIYLDLAKTNLDSQEEMMFQAALVQSQYDKELAFDTFDRIAKLGQTKEKEATYNRLILAFDLGRYEEVSNETVLKDVPPEKLNSARLFLGRSLLNMKKYEAAVSELKKYIEEESPSETFHAALCSLLEASYQLGQLESLDYAIEKLKTAYPEDSELPKAYFSRAQILKKNAQYEAAKKQIEDLLSYHPDFPQKAQALFELAYLEYKVKAWDKCYEITRDFLDKYPDHDLTSRVRNYHIAVSAERAEQNPNLKPNLVSDLEAFLNLPMAIEERKNWELLLGKTLYDLKQYEQAIHVLQNIDTPNSLLLLALCYRDGKQDSSNFCALAEKALLQGADLITPAELHTSLFNAYLSLDQMDQAAEHLYAVFASKTNVKSENLLWLADYYFSKMNAEENPFALAYRAALILEECIPVVTQKSMEEQNPDDECKAALHSSETLACKLAKTYSILGRFDDEIKLLEQLSNPNLEAQLLLAESYARKGLAEKAMQMFDGIVSSSANTRDPLYGSASLQAARLKMGEKNPNLAKIAAQLKTLVIQKNFEGEPIYLEAALDYVDLQAKGDLIKKIALLQKTKSDFESQDDIFSKDYHAARSKWPQKEKIYQGYLQFIDAQILAMQSMLESELQDDLRAKSKTLLLKIINEQCATTLLERAQMLLTNIDEPK